MATFELNVRINGVEQSVSTIGALEQALAATNQQLTSVEKGSREFQFLTNQAKNLENVLVAVSDDARKFSTNLNSVNNAADKLNDTFTETVQITEQLGQNEGTERLNANINDTVTKATSLRTELRKITLELQNLEPGSARFQELSLRAGELRDQISDTGAIVGVLAGNVAERLGGSLELAFTQGIVGLQGLQQGLQGAGVESEGLTKTLQVLQGVLGAVSLIKFAGALPDTIDQIKAGFSSTIPAIRNYIAGIFSTTTVTEGATVATRALAIAQNALPIVAITAGIATLAFALYDYSKSNERAKKLEEERKETLEKTKKTEKEYAESIAAESIEFVNLALQLSNTERLSKERDKQIKAINKQYGSTLKNLSDEALFQKQINDAVKEYIALEVVRFKLDKNKESERKSIEKLVDAENKLNKLKKETLVNFQLTADARAGALGDYQAELRFINGIAAANRDTNIENLQQVKIYRQVAAEFKELTKQYEDANASLQKQAEYRSNLIKKEQEYINTLFPNQDKDKKNTDNKTKSVKDLTEAELFLAEIQKQREKAATEAAIAEAKKTKSLVDDINVERTIAIDALNERLRVAKDNVDKEVKSKKKATAEKKQIDADYRNYLIEINAKFDEDIKKQLELEKKARLELYAELKLQNSILQEEILFGNESTVDTLKNLQIQQKEFEFQQLEDRIENEEFTNLFIQKNYEEALKQRADAAKLLAEEQAKIELDIAKANRRKDFIDYRELLETQTGLKLTQFNELSDYDMAIRSLTFESQRAIADLEAKLAAETNEEKKKSLQNELTATKENYRNQELVFENLKKTQTNLNLKFAQDEIEINNEKNEKIAAADEQTTQKTFDKRLEILNQYFSLASAALSEFSVNSLGGFNTSISQSLDLISGLFELSNKEFDTTIERVGAYAQLIGSTLNAVLSSFIDQNQAALDRDLENFRISADEQKAIYTQQLNDNLITRDTYDKNIEAIDKALYEKQQKAKKDAFEQDKKLRIAQATIAGLQGAVAAFAGAMQLGPIAGPIVGALLAAAVATLTAAQISQIQKQKFDSGPGRIDAGAGAAPSAAQINQSSSGGFTSFNENVPGANTQTGTTTTPVNENNMQKVYVLESDISAVQQRVRVLENNSTFG